MEDPQTKFEVMSAWTDALLSQMHDVKSGMCWHVFWIELS